MTDADFELLESQYKTIQIKLERGSTLSKREHRIAMEYNAAMDKMADGTLSVVQETPDLDLNFGVAPHDVAPGVFENGIQGINDELGFVEPPEEATQAEKRFILAYAQAVPTKEAYLAAFSPSKSPSNEEMWGHIRKIFEKPALRQYLDELNKRVEDVAIATKAEIELYLTAAMKATLQSTGTDSPLCRKAVVTRQYNKEGDVVGQRLERQLVDPLKAIQILNSMRGYDQPKEINLTHKGGVMVVPMTSSDEEWLKIAETQQQKLIEETIDV